MKFAAIALLLMPCILVAADSPPPCTSCAGPEESMGRLETAMYEGLVSGSDKLEMTLSPDEAAELAAYIKERHKKIEGVELTEPQAAILAGYIVGVRAAFRYAADSADEQ